MGPMPAWCRSAPRSCSKAWSPDLTDAFNVADLSETVLLADPARLADEAAAISMMGGRRVVRVRGAGNDLADLLESFLDDPKGDALVVIEAGDLAKTSALRKLFDGPQDRRRHPMLSPTRCALWATCCAMRYGPKVSLLPPMLWKTRSRGLVRIVA